MSEEITQFKFGRIRPTTRPPLSFTSYFLAVTPPASVDYGPAAVKSLSRMYLNDQLGDCVIAGGAHVRGVTSANAGNEIQFTDQQIVNMYGAACGYNGSSWSDRGCNEQEVMNYWKKTGFSDGVKLAGWVGVDATDQQQCMAALYLFENLFFGMEMPNAWLSVRNGFVWDVAGSPNPNNGHCVIGYGYDEKGIKISTWGVTGTMTWAAVKKYVVPNVGGELYTLLSPDMVNQAVQKAPNGLNWYQLVTDFNQLGGNVPVPPEPPPPVPPTPPTPPTPPVPPVPPIPPGPNPPSDFQKEFDAIIQDIISRFPDKPYVVLGLQLLQYVVDIYLSNKK